MGGERQMTKTKAQTQKGRGATGGGQIARMYRAIRECPWPEIAQGPRGGPLAKAVMLTLATYADADGGSVWPGDELVSDKIGASRIAVARMRRNRSEEHTSELQSLAYLVCRLLLEKKK